MTSKPISQSAPTNSEPSQTVGAEQLRKCPVTRQKVLVQVPSHSLCSYGHEQNDSYVHTVSGILMERTVAVVELPAGGPSALPSRGHTDLTRQMARFNARLQAYAIRPLT